MKFNWEVSIGDVIAFCALVGSILMFFLTNAKQRKTKYYAENANAYNDSARKYYDLMVEQIKAKKHSASEKAYCDANIVKIGSNRWILKVFNKGNAYAKNIHFNYLTEGAPDVIGPDGKTFPIKLLEPQKNVDYHLMIHLGLSSLSWDYEITWINKDGTTDSKKGVLTLPLS